MTRRQMEIMNTMQIINKLVAEWKAGSVTEDEIRHEPTINRLGRRSLQCYDVSFAVSPGVGVV